MKVDRSLGVVYLYSESLAEVVLVLVFPKTLKTTWTTGVPITNFHSSMMQELPKHPLFQVRNEFLSKDESITLSYRRARLVLRSYG